MIRLEKELWVNHLLSWKAFLLKCIASADNKGDTIKYERQLKTIERVRCGAVLNPVLLTDFINPSLQKSSDFPCEEYFFDMNESQKRAVMHALGDGNLTLIQGPPGTGKTQVIAEICLQLLKAEPGLRILISSETHVAVNTVLSRIAEKKDQIRIVRIQDKANDEKVDKFSSSQVVEAYLKWATNCIENKDAYSILQDELHNPEEKSLEKALALSANIVGMTCNKVSSYDFRDSTEMFDVAIVDEVCKATLPEILSPLIVSRKAILLGDPMQLPPVFCSDELEIIRDIQSCQLDKYMYIDNLFNESVNVTVLNTQYRMSNQIGSMISDLFYKPAGVNLINGRNLDIAESIKWIDYVPTQMWPTQQDQALARPRIYNDDECRIVSAIARRFVEEDSEVTVAIIAPYHAQVESLRKMCSSLPNRVKIDTVDGFQGDEKDVVIFSVTRTTGPYRFFTDIRRLNVALSRAKNNLYIVGYTEYCLRNNILHDIYQRSTVESIQIE